MVQSRKHSTKPVASTEGNAKSTAGLKSDWSQISKKLHCAHNCITVQHDYWRPQIPELQTVHTGLSHSLPENKQSVC